MKPSKTSARQKLYSFEAEKIETDKVEAELKDEVLEVLVSKEKRLGGI